MPIFNKILQAEIHTLEMCAKQGGRAYNKE